MMSNNTMNENMDMSMDPMMPMPMFMYWTSECWFIFKT